MFKFDPFSYRYASRRNVVYGTRGMTATSNPLAAAAGMEILKKGGNAADAAIATAAALTVVEPTGNGLGSDAFAIIWKDGKLHGLNASGPAPEACTIEKYRSLGCADEIPQRGWLSATVPGAPAAWAELSSKMGRLPLSVCLEPAILYAEEGYAAAVTVSRLWDNAYRAFGSLGGAIFKHWFDAFCPNGRAPRPGEPVRLPHHARTLRLIAESGARDFYEGETAEKIIAFSESSGGLYSAYDLSSFAPEWVEPISVKYKGFDVWEMPPNGQGITALVALKILDGLDIPDGHDCPFTVHKQIEAIKLAFADAKRYVADPKFSAVPVDELLSDDYAASRRALIGPTAREFSAGSPYSGGTVYLSAADADGCMVSYIQSNFNGFGSAVVVPETGIALNNRAKCFSLDPSHPNALAPRKRPYNTIIPAFLSQGGEPIGPFGVMGAYMQPQGHVQVIMNCLLFGMNPQDALDAPRWQWTGGMKVSVEPSFHSSAAQKLSRMGHDVTHELHSTDFGRGQIIWRTEEGSLAGATEPRTDGAVEAW
ncbi:gamma-glutamyltransferase [Synergistales bacterium]|nr:gamma-glutamyltransferase [Synergistales bacterium]